MNHTADGLGLPLVLIAGFLGAGKTTLVNRIMTNPGGRRIAVIVNDIGEINIDAELIRESDADQLSLTNGCICCSLKTDLFDAVHSLVNGVNEIDAIVVEASGLAEPSSLVSNVKLLDEAGLAFADTLLYLIDAGGYDKLDYEEAEHVLDSAALSDMVLINKCDIASEEKLSGILDELAIVAPEADIQQVSHAEFPLEYLFSPSVHKSATGNSRDKFESRSKFSGEDFAQLTLTTTECIDEAAFMRFVAGASNVCWRIKGFVRFCTSPTQLHLLQVVGRRASLEQFARSSDLTTRLVFVSRVDQFDEEKIRDGFERCKRIEAVS